MSDLHAANRREDLRLIAGQGRYSADWNLPGQLLTGSFSDYCMPLTPSKVWHAIQDAKAR